MTLILKQQQQQHVSSHLHQRIRNLVVHLLSGMVHTVGAIEGKLLGRLFWSSGPLDETLAALRLHGQHRLAPQSLLPVVQGPAPDHHLNRLGAHVSTKVTPCLPEDSPRTVSGRRLCLQASPRTELKCRLMDGRADGRTD